MISLTSPVRTRAHGWPAGAKLAALCVASVGLFAVSHWAVQGAVALAVLAVYAAPGRVFAVQGLRRLWPLWPFVVLLALWHGLTGTPSEGALVALRMFNAVALANLVTMTTPLAAMMEVVRVLLAPVVRSARRLDAIALAAAMVIRFTPVIAQKGAALAMAWRARARRRAGWRIVMPLMVLALDDADHVAEALRARGGIGMDETT